MDGDSKIFVVGDGSALGSVLVRSLKSKGFSRVIGESALGLNMLKQDALRAFFAQEKPEYVFLLHSRSGGILANTKFPAELMYQNLQIQTSVIHEAGLSGAKKLLYLGSSCMYSPDSSQPFKEGDLFTGKLEKSSEAFAMAKLSGLKMCQAYNQQYGLEFIAAIPATMYGPQDDFDDSNSHVIPAVIRKMHEAKLKGDPQVTLFGSGGALREFIFFDDMSDACIFLMGNDTASGVINVGTAAEISILSLAMLIKDIVGFKGELGLDVSMPEGAPRKLLDSGKIISLGWAPRVSLEEGITRTYQWFEKLGPR
jgi:GDP-L-fucose synthase